MSDEKASGLMDYAIRKALAAGWQLPFEEPILSITVSSKPVDDVDQLEPYVRMEIDDNSQYGDYCVGLPGILFDLGFAQTLWPGYVDLATHEVYEVRPAGIPTAERWKVHEQMMVVSTERLRYLAKAVGYAVH